jgi:hypothetical protein
MFGVSDVSIWILPEGWRAFEREDVASIMCRHMPLECGGFPSPREQVRWFLEARARIASLVEWGP